MRKKTMVEKLIHQPHESTIKKHYYFRDALYNKHFKEWKAYSETLDALTTPIIPILTDVARTIISNIHRTVMTNG
jgi:hypothetical protein